MYARINVEKHKAAIKWWVRFFAYFLVLREVTILEICDHKIVIGFDPLFTFRLVLSGTFRVSRDLLIYRSKCNF